MYINYIGFSEGGTIRIDYTYSGDDNEESINKALEYKNKSNRKIFREFRKDMIKLLKDKCTIRKSVGSLDLVFWCPSES